MPANRLLSRITEIHPLAITMWDFSWLERRWPGAGYEDWGRALDELADRGYDAVRIDAFPHFAADDPEMPRDLRVHWTTQDWGSPAPNRIRLFPELNDFIDACHCRGLRVALSSWFRRDRGAAHEKIRSARDLAEAWIQTLCLLGDRTDRLLYVDLCNEWPLHHWAHFFPGQKTGPLEMEDWSRPDSLEWMRTSIARVREEFPSLPLCYSILNLSTPGEDQS